jgi:outer membrane protein TolC
LTIHEVLTRATANAPAVLTAVERARASSAQIDVNRAQYLPSVSLSTSPSLSVSNGNYVAAAGVPSVGQTIVSGQIDATVGARWTIFDFGRTSAAVAVAEASARASRIDIESSRRAAVSAAVAAFYAVVLDQAAVEVARESERQRTRSLAVTRGFTDAGARPPIELTRAEVALSSARVDIANALAQLRVDQTALLAAIGFEGTEELEVRPPSTLPEVVDLTSAAQAASVRPEVLATHQRVQVADAQARAAQRGYWPVLSANANASLRYTERFGQPGSGVSETATAAVSLVWPVFDPTVAANVRLAEANASVARAQDAQTLFAARSEAMQAVVAARVARQAIEQAEVLVRGAAATLALAEGRYANGAATLIELVDAQTSDAQARGALIRARWQWEAAKARAWIAQGNTDAFR